jgi:quercetin dioxygenase-like cupin family protein
MTTSNARPLARPRGTGTTVRFLGTDMTLLATGEETRGAFGLMEQALPPGFGPPPHVHHGEDEAFYILEGGLTFTCGERTLRAEAGTFVFLPRDVAHTFHVDDDAPARLLQLNAPGGIERFFVEAADAPDRPPDLDRVLALTGKYRFEIV